MRTLAVIAGLAALLPGVTNADAPIAIAAFSSLCGGDQGGGAADPKAPVLPTVLLSGYGGGGIPIRTSNTQAQAFFSNGMQLGHAFAHEASTAAFVEARKLDANCAMCVWGEAWSRGPTINYDIDAKTQAELVILADKAAELAKGGPVIEQQLTAALQKRYKNGGGGGLGDLAYAQAMDDLSKAYPDNNEIAILAADAWMIPASMRDSEDNLPRAMAIIEGILKRDPDYTPAIHFYIHVTEMSHVGAKALPYAERLQALAPKASHLVHMPSHTYYWVGQYQEAAKANVDAANLDMADAVRLGLPEQEGAWKQGYHGHNVQFGIGGALMANDAASALYLSDATLQMMVHLKPEEPWPQMGAATSLFAQGRFADPAKVMALPDPGAKLPFVRAMWHYARGEAAARTGDAKAVRAEAAQIKLGGGDVRAFGRAAKRPVDLADVARFVLLGRAAMLENNPTEAAKNFRKAADIQEARLMSFRDPPLWWFPVRRSLAAALLRAGDAAGAMTEAQTVLKTFPDDPMALTVLAEAERATGKMAEAATHFADARKRWKGDLTKVTLDLI